MRTVVIPCLAVLVLSAGCDMKPTEIGPGAGANGGMEGSATTEAGSRPPVVLPPSIVGSKSFRCSDNSLALVEFYSDLKSASVRTKSDGKPVRVLSEQAGGTMTAEGGWSLKGGPKDPKVTFSSPDHPKPMSCHV